MAGIHFQWLVDAIPGCTTLMLPPKWFDKLPDDVSVFRSLYRWMMQERGIEPPDLNVRTYAGAGVMRRLLAAERKRLARVQGLRGDALENALAFSDLNIGPNTSFADHTILGDGLVIVPDDDELVSVATKKLLDEAIDKNVAKYRRLAAGSDFRTWLMSNIGRDDPIGDLAGDASRDDTFPKKAEHHHELYTYLSRHHPHPGALDALDEAWLEYRERYPERVSPSAWCHGCAKRIESFAQGFIVWLDEEELALVCPSCLPSHDGPTTTLNDVAGEHALERLEAFAEQHSIPAWALPPLEKRLRVCALAPLGAAKQTRVYFIQSGAGGPIKIGYTARTPKMRLTALQTSHPEPLRLLAEMRGDRETEAQLHERFRKCRKSGEWFEPHPDLIAFISTLRAT